MKTLQMLLAAVLMVASSVAVGGWGVPYGPGWGEPYGPGEPQGPKAGPKTAELDPADVKASGYTGADGTGFGQWADSDAGAQQPGQGAPWSGVRPPK